MKESPLQNIAFNFRLHYLLKFSSYVSKVGCVLYAPFLFPNYDLNKTKGVAKITNLVLHKSAETQRHETVARKLKPIHKREKKLQNTKISECEEN